MTKEKIKNSIYTYISVNIFPQIKEGIDCTKNLFEEYCMDSIAIVVLILYLEEEFEIEFDLMNVDLVELKSIEAISENVYKIIKDRR